MKQLKTIDWVKYDTLYAAGCSFTWHHPLKLEETWPWHLQKRLGIKNLVNNGQGGGSNYTAFRRTEEYCRTHDTSNHLAVIQLTNPVRFETFDPDFPDGGRWLHHIPSQIVTQEEWNEAMNLPFRKLKIEKSGLRSKDNANKFMVERMSLWNKTFEFYTYFHQIHAIENVLRKAGIDVYFMNYNCSEVFTEEHTTLLSESFNWINGNFNDGDILNVGQLRNPNKLGLLPGLFVDEGDHHPNSPGNERIAKFIFEWIKDNPLP